MKPSAAIHREDPALVEAARQGQPGAFDALVQPLLPRLEAYATRMVAHPEDAAELVQEALLRGHQKLSTFRADSKFSTWLFSVLTRLCLDHLRAKGKWRWDAQAHARANPDAPHDQVVAQLADPTGRFEAREHIAFCFSCVGRSLPPEEAAALMLRDVFAFSNREAADICGISESVLRHRLSAARQAMQDRFEDLCGLVNKKGVCHQCKGLREHTPEALQGEALPTLDAGDAGQEPAYRHRLKVIADADLEEGASAELHRLMFRLVADNERRR